MREIKFRVWDKELKQFNSPNVHHLEKNNGILNIVLNSDIQKISGNDRFTIQQYTGLKDKNGVEIYESDIVEFTNSECSQWVECIEFDLMSWNYHLCDICEELDKEVIGNIFENPELLQQ